MEPESAETAETAEHQVDSGDTKRLLIDVAIRHLSLYGWEGTQLPAIVDDVHVAKSSLYHFFGSREGLLAAATAEQYRRTLLAEDARVVDDARACQTEQEFLSFLERELLRVATDPATIAARKERVIIAAAALTREELSAEVASAQHVFVDAMAEIICDAQERGLINSSVNPTSYASWLHGMTLGRTLTESSCSDPVNWLAVAVPAALAPLRLEN